MQQRRASNQTEQYAPASVEGQFELFPYLTPAAPHPRNANAPVCGQWGVGGRDEQRDHRRRRWRLRRHCIQFGIKIFQELMRISLRASHSLGDETAIDKNGPASWIDLPTGA